MHKSALIFFTLVALSISSMGGPMAVRIKDAARFAGSDRYTLVGYGLVVGLNGTGDSDQELTQQSIVNLLHNFNIKLDPADVKAQNCAVVMLTLTLNDGVHKGDLLTATISSIGDATSLQGGELLLTPLLGEDGTPWALAQGSVVVGGFQFGSGGAGGESQTKNHPTVGKLPGGVKMMRDIDTVAEATGSVRIFLKRPDYTTAVNLAAAINREHVGLARAINHSTVLVTVPDSYLVEGTVPVFLSELEQIRFSPDQRAKIVFSERTGTIVIGREVRIDSVAISHGSISVSIKNTVGVSQPAPFRGGGDTVVANDQQTAVAESRAQLQVLPETTSVGDLVDMLNALGVTPRDIMSIFVALQQSGALHAELEPM